ncbi:PDGLE domain-containing protein [Phycicoccus sonneratiae]|uniref:PDGLE domain-containing protein n=1 Tax=Phycicoccus sonneratiae TaxID=2807628 RepID=A0ABS2CID2_9MICO|nr:PDGLE domain-containing protein [Phycicoccus sonneraticus]MBM6399608.1 PDGLE domain-containing protein [Phycicoccus sonneraticus]
MSAPTAAARISTRRLVLVGLAVCLVIAGVVSFYASSHPDGLEYVAGSLGFDGVAQDSATAGSPLADYAVRGVSDNRLSGGLAGLVGAVVTGLLMFGLVMLARRRAPRGRD